MIRPRQILAVTLVATALAADRAVATVAAERAPAQRQASVMSVAGRFVSKLSRNFRRAVPAVRLVEARRGETPLATRIAFAADHRVLISHVLLSPFQFRLPPPVL